MKELLISFLACLVIGAVINGMSAPSATTPTESGTTQTQESSGEQSEGGGSSSSAVKAQETSDATFEQDVLKSDLPVLVDFGASWCQPCQRMAPIIDNLAKSYEGKVKVFKVDTDHNPGLSAKYQINSLPTFMMFRAGRSVASHSGAMPQEMLAGVIDRQLGTQ